MQAGYKNGESELPHPAAQGGYGDFRVGWLWKGQRYGGHCVVGRMVSKGAVLADLQGWESMGPMEG